MDRTLASGASASLSDTVLPKALSPQQGLLLKHTATAIREDLLPLLLKLNVARRKRQAPGSTSQPRRPQVILLLVLLCPRRVVILRLCSMDSTNKILRLGYRCYYHAAVGLYNTPAVWQALEQRKRTLQLDSKPSYRRLGPFPNTPDKTLDWKSVKLSKSHLCSEPQKPQIVMPWSLPLSES